MEVLAFLEAFFLLAILDPGLVDLPLSPLETCFLNSFLGEEFGPLFSETLFFGRGFFEALLLGRVCVWVLFYPSFSLETFLSPF